jgi:hypothetical protein
MRPYLENTQYKKGAGGMVQVLELLPSKHEALSSNPSTTKKEQLGSLHSTSYSKIFMQTYT